MAKITILTSLYRSAPYVEEFYRRSKAAVEPFADAMEFVFVDDGCPDGSGEIVEKLIESDPSVRLVELARNAGQHRALMTGLAYATGDVVFMLDSDLEEEPELFERLYEPLQTEGKDVDLVYGVMEKRKGGVAERFSGWLYYSLMQLLSEVPMPRDILMARVMSRRFVDALLKYDEHHVYLGGLMELVGFERESIVCSKGSREGSGYTFAKRLNLAIDSITSLSDVPLRFIFYAGALVSALGGLTTLILFVRALAFEQLHRLAIVLSSLYFLGGIILMAIGIVGIYVGRTYHESKKRPRTIVKRVVPPQS